MIKTNAKVIVDDSDSKLVISILPNISSTQKALFIGWIILWLAVGIAAMSYYGRAEEQEKILVIIYLGFWAYFSFTSLRRLLWNLYGAEHLKVEGGELTYKRGIKGYGRVVHFDGTTIKEFGVLNLEKKPFIRSFGEDFWSPGGEQLGFEYLGRKVVFGVKLTKEDAEKVVRLITRKLKATRKA